MIVEDDKDICRELKEMLDHAGYEAWSCRIFTTDAGRS